MHGGIVVANVMFSCADFVPIRNYTKQQFLGTFQAFYILLSWEYVIEKYASGICIYICMSSGAQTKLSRHAYPDHTGEYLMHDLI